MYGFLPYNKVIKEDCIMSQTKTSRLEARTTDDIYQVIKQAALIEGRTISDFVISTVEKAARKTLEKAHLIELSQADQQQFVTSLIAPDDPVPAMHRAATHHDTLIQS
jgi:uncharacterized protein (DUF1778 family)